jgi:D-sedoheptulose 7-phosphate isomerase
MDLQQRVFRYFEMSMDAQRETAAALSAEIVRAAEILTECLLQGSKILSCGPASSSGQAQYFASAMLNRFERERPGLPVFCISHDAALLTSVANDASFREIYARQIKTLGQQGDILLLICAGRTTRSVIEAIKAAHERSMIIIALTGDDGAEIADLLQSADLELRVSAQRAANTQETHLITINILCDLIDTQIFGDES